MTWPAIIVWIALLLGLLSQKPILLYVGAVVASFGTLQMVPGDLVGGTNFLPSSVYATLLVIKILFRQKPSRMIKAALDPGCLGLLFSFYIWCLLSAYIMPRLFAGQVDVIPIAAIVPWPVPLEPTNGNITQPAYLTISIFSALAAYFAASNPDFIKHCLQASAVGGFALIATGLADILLSTSGQSGLLEPFRTATYALLTEVDVLGSKRVVGLMPEASSYGGACVGALTGLAFLRPCFEPLWRDKIVPVAILGLIIMALLSTSSAAYVGLGATALLYGVNWLRRRRSASVLVRSGLSVEASVVVAACFVFLLLLAFQPQVLDPIYALIDQIIFQKSQSSSFEERNMWTRVGLEAFYGTYGLGVGFGGARTSNWFAAELSNTGAIGAILLGVFLLKSLFSVGRRASPEDQEMIKGLKLALLPGFVLGFLAGTSADIPGTFALGLLLGLRFRFANQIPANGGLSPHMSSKYFSAARRQV